MPQYLSRTGKRIFCSPGEFRRWNDFPYGKWTCADGREVLFNRFYEPILQRRPGNPVTPADPKECVPSYIHLPKNASKYEALEWFYGDYHTERQKRSRAQRVMDEWAEASRFSRSGSP